MKKCIFFGASKLGKLAFLKLKHSYKIKYFCDNDKRKWGKILLGIEIISPKRLKYETYDDIIITSQYDIDIANQLIMMGIKRFSVFTIQNFINKKNNEFYNLINYDYNDLNEFKTIENKISLISMNNSGSNTLALSKLIPDKIKKKYNIKLINVFDKDSFYYYDLLTSKMIIKTHDLAYKNNQINVQLWHGFPLKGLSYMSKTYEQDKERNHNNWNELDSIMSYSQFYSTILNSCYGVEIEKYKITGMPRNDFLFLSDGRKNLEKLISTFLGDKKVIFYMPTFRESVFGERNGDSNMGNIFNMESFNSIEFDSFLNRNNLILIIKNHPIQDKMFIEHIKEYKLKNIFLIQDSKLQQYDIDLYEVLNSVDLLITDYSSVFFDFLLVDRPIIFIPLDIEIYRKTRGLLLEPYDLWTPGPKCLDILTLQNEILKSLENRDYYYSERCRLKSIVHYYHDGESSQRVWKFVDNTMSSL